MVVLKEEGGREKQYRWVSSSILRMRSHDCDAVDKIAIATTPKYKQCPVAIETVGAVRAGAAHFPIHARVVVACPWPVRLFLTSFFKISFLKSRQTV